MTNLARLGPMGLKPDRPTAAERAAGREHMARVAQLPCVICGRRPVEVHHCICGRFSQRRTSDLATIPLCVCHHREGPFSIHQNKALWVKLNGPDTDYLPLVADMLAGEAASDDWAFPGQDSLNAMLMGDTRTPEEE